MIYYQVVIQCDKCKNELEGAVYRPSLAKVGETRDEARKRGWTFTKLHTAGGPIEDICPECQKSP